MIRVFFAHPKSMDDADIDAWCIEITKRFADKGHDVHVISGRDDFRKRMGALGGWPNWVRDVATGTTMMGEPRFSFLVLPYRAMGRATSDMITMALGAGRHVLCFEDGTIRRVVDVAQVSTSMVDGWDAVLAPVAPKAVQS